MIFPQFLKLSECLSRSILYLLGLRGWENNKLNSKKKIILVVLLQHIIVNC